MKRKTITVIRRHPNNWLRGLGFGAILTYMGIIYTFCTVFGEAYKALSPGQQWLVSFPFAFQFFYTLGIAIYLFNLATEDKEETQEVIEVVE